MKEEEIDLHSKEAEQSVLGGVMLNNEIWYDMIEVVQETDFYFRENQLIFRAMTRLMANNTPIDPITIAEFLSTHDFLEKIGGGAYLGGLFSNTPSSHNALAYGHIVRERAIRRQLVTAAEKIKNSAIKPDGKDSQELLSQAEQKILSINNQAQQTQFKSLEQILPSVMGRIETLADDPNALHGLKTGFGQLDDLTTGLQPSDLIIIAGRPSMGKTAFAMNIASYVAVEQKLPVAVFSMEMSDEQLTLRLISSLAQVNLQCIRTGQNLSDDNWSEITKAVTRLEVTALHIDESPALDSATLRARARRLHRDAPLGCVVVDYLQLMQSHGEENRNNEIQKITQGLKALAKELKIPVIALSQLNRSLEVRQDKRPKMSDLRESGSIEQEADLILFVYRDEVYDNNSPDAGTAEIIIGKQRNGPLGMVRLNFQGNTVSFKNGQFYSNEEL